MAITVERVLGRHLTIETNGASTSLWDTLSIQLPSEDFEGTAAASLYKQFVEGQIPQAVLRVTGFLGADNANLPANGDEVTGIDIKVASDSIVPEDLSDPGREKWKVRNVQIDAQAGPAKYSFEIKSGYLE